MTKEERIYRLKQIEKDINVCSLDATFEETAKSCAIRSAIEELEERKTDTCTNDGKDYAECDQFVCSACGIELQDWHRVERDMDDGEVSYHEYTFRFCPHCGRKIVEGSEMNDIERKKKLHKHDTNIAKVGIQHTRRD